MVPRASAKRPDIAGFAGCLVVVLGLAGCGTTQSENRTGNTSFNRAVFADKTAPKVHKSAYRGRRFRQVGWASWYGGKFQGRKTASGERFNMNAMTAAHRTLPFGTKVRVINLSNKRSVVVRINDRGPFARDRIIDLSRRAARALGYVRKGRARVRIEALPG